MSPLLPSVFHSLAATAGGAGELWSCGAGPLRASSGSPPFRRHEPTAVWKDHVFAWKGDTKDVVAAFLQPASLCSAF